MNSVAGERSPLTIYDAIAQMKSIMSPRVKDDHGAIGIPDEHHSVESDVTATRSCESKPKIGVSARQQDPCCARMTSDLHIAKTTNQVVPR